VKGFAVTLSLGVLASLFTALIVSRVLFDFYLNKTKTATLRI
jgi:preprotein translocase subunit SecD